MRLFKFRSRNDDERTPIRERLGRVLAEPLYADSTARHMRSVR